MEYQDLRDWIQIAEEMGELKTLKGCDWNLEIGAITEIVAHKEDGPAVLFEDIKGYPKGYRVLSNSLSSRKRLALTLGLPSGETKMDFVKIWKDNYKSIKPVPAKFVKKSALFDNVYEDGDIDMFKFPTPLWHDKDGGRYIGTGSVDITRDPDEGWVNYGTYRVMIHDKNKLGFYISPGKHGRIQREKYAASGKPFKIAMSFGHDPLTFLAGSIEVPYGVPEYEFIGGLRGEPFEMIEGEYSGLPIPANAEIVIEGEAVPGQSKPEGPFGEWMGYYSDDVVPRPYLNVKTVMYRNNPILTCAPQHKPVDETGLLKGIAGAAEIWNALEACGLPDILGVWNHEGAPATRFTAIQIRQRYPGHARNVLHVASNCMAGAYNGKWTVVVDDDVDCSDMDQVLWAMGTRFDPITDIDLVQKAWSSGRDPMFLPGNFNNRILIDACVPYNRKLRGEFPKVVEVPEKVRAELKAKFPQVFKARS